MKPHPRIRKTIKWGGAAVTVLLVVVWIGSAVYPTLCALPSGVQWGAGAGCIVAGRDSFANGMYPAAGWYFSKPQWELWWLPSWSGSGAYWDFVIPLWPFVFIAALSTAVGWRLDTLARRARLNRCRKCDYDRAGLAADAKCPECGAAPSSPEG
jgi:hypothetical protein